MNNAGRKEYAVYVITRHGIKIAESIIKEIPSADLYVSSRFIGEAPRGSFAMDIPMGPTLEKTFMEYNCHVHIISVGAVVRMIKDLLQNKKVDPAVVCVDDSAKYSICVLSGHVGRGNYYAKKIASILSAVPVVTTASDSIGTLSVDILGRELGWILDDDERNVTRGCAAVVNSDRIAFIQEAGEPDFWPLDEHLPDCIRYFRSLDEAKAEDYDFFLIVSDREFLHSHADHHKKSVIYRPKSLVLGIGCDKHTPLSVIERGVLYHVEKNYISLKSVKAVASIDLKKDEPGIIELCDKYGWDFVTYPAEVLDRVEGVMNPSESVKKYTGSKTVAEGACLKLSGAKKLLLTKQSFKESHDVHTMTVAFARIPFEVREIDMKVDIN